MISQSNDSLSRWPFLRFVLLCEMELGGSATVTPAIPGQNLSVKVFTGVRLM